MRSLSETDHYEVLEVAPNATRDEIEGAYRLAKATYAEDSIATYSVLEEQDSAVLLEQIELAYRVLSDPEARRGYDAARREGAAALRVAEARRATETGEERADTETDAAVRAAFDEIEVEEAITYDGARLRQTRIFRGLTLEQIASTTKINPTYLRFLEEERFADLPAAVYVRGFVTSYARCVGLDPGEAAAGYMTGYRAREAGGRSRPQHASLDAGLQHR